MSREKAKGTRFESEAVDVLRGFLPWVERRAPSGTRDRGDVSGVPGFVLEMKNHARLELARWVDEAKREADNAGTPWFAVVHKRKGRGAADAYVTLPLLDFARFVRAAYDAGAIDGY